MKLRLISSGKSAVLSGQVNADLFIDCRGMVNPFRDPVLSGKTGDDPEVQNWILSYNKDYIEACRLQIIVALASASSRNSFKACDKPLTVCFFCLAGVHRSRGMKNVLGQVFRHILGGDKVEVL
jgi:RNase adaptor protein for sRNA GlmZ degradation